MRKFIALPMLVAAGFATSVQAGETLVPKQKFVRYQDLDLSSLDGRKKLEFRIRHAARAVCEIEDLRNLPMISENARCYEKAISSARQQLAVRGIDVRLAIR